MSMADNVVRRFVGSSWTDKQNEATDAESAAVVLEGLLGSAADRFDAFRDAHRHAREVWADLESAVACETPEDFGANLESAKKNAVELASALDRLKAVARKDPDVKEALEEIADAFKDLRRHMRDLLD